MDFGKHKGTCISELPADYLLWLLFEKKTIFNRVSRYIIERKEELIAKQDSDIRVVASKKITIACIKGKLVRKVTAIKPTCPRGYFRR